jgi:hypothetical protein
MSIAVQSKERGICSLPIHRTAVKSVSKPSTYIAIAAVLGPVSWLVVLPSLARVHALVS